MPFVSQMFGLVLEAESLAGSALAFGLFCSVSEKEGRQPVKDWLPSSKTWVQGGDLHRQIRKIIVVLSR